MLLVNDPVPVPSEVFEFAIVEFADVLQHTPREVIVEPPSEVMVPPQLADVMVMFEADEVETVGRFPLVEKVTSDP